MSLIPVPSNLRVKTCGLELSVNTRSSSSSFGGSEQVVDLLNDRWLLKLDIPSLTYTNAAPVEAFLNALRSKANTCNLYHYARPQPNGTICGTLTLGAAAAQGANQIIVAGCVPTTGTFKAGDMLGVGGLLVMVQTDCTAVAGSVTVPIVNRLRTAQSSGASVVWDAPTAQFRRLSSGGLEFIAAMSNPITLDFAEKI